MTAPYSPAVAGLIADPLEHVAAVRALPRAGDPVPLEIDGDSLELTLSEDWAPYAQARGTFLIPDALESLDPRLNARLEIDLGYVYPDGTRDVHTVANLGIRTRPVRRPDNVLELDAGSAEYRAQDYRAMWWAGMERRGINEAVRWLAGYAEHPDTPRVSSVFGANYGAAALAEIEVDLGSDYWSLMDDAAARTGVRVWCDELGVWQIGRRVEAVGAVRHELTVGEGGTIVTSDAGLDREEWANGVCLRYRWIDAANNERIVYGRAQLASGPFATNAVGHKVHFEEISRPVSLAAANAAAAAKLRILSTRGRSLSLTAAAAYWLRPGQTVRVALPTGTSDLHIVQSVTFRPGLGLMDVTTRQPLDAAISNGEL